MQIARTLLVLSITSSIIIVAYSVAMTAAVGQTLAYGLAAIGAGILALLVLMGLIDADRADDGLLTSILALLPTTLQQATSSVFRALSVSFLLLGLAALSFWVGPAGIGAVAVACGDAKKIQPIVGDVPIQCTSSYTERYWRAPFDRSKGLPLVCFDDSLVEWVGTWNTGDRGSCGSRPQEARFVQVGIDFPENGAPLTTSVGARDRSAFERLASGLEAEIPQVRQLDDTMLFATWNIRWLGRAERLDISYAHIAQVISHFDIVAFQELQSQDGLNKILFHLGPDWRAEYGLESPGRMGNRERLGFVYDTRKVQVDPVSSNMVLETSDLFHTATGQPARPPFVAAFSVNGRKVLIANTHIVFGRPDARADRIAELQVIAQNLAYHADNSFEGIPAILAGDINSERSDGPVIAAVEAAGFQTDATLRSAASSVFTDRVYDQIFIREDPVNRLAFGQTGTFNPFDYIMRREDMPLYKADLAREVDLTNSVERNINLYLRWRSGEISDHRLKWSEFRMDW